MLSQLSKSEYTIINDSTEFINYMKKVSIPSNNKLISFGAKFRFYYRPNIETHVRRQRNTDKHKVEGNERNTSFMYKKCTF